MRWTIRGLGFISTLILARLLQPSDFGLVAMAMIVVNLADILSQSGNRLALIRHPAPKREHYDTAWTISLLTGVLIFGLLLLIGPLAGRFFQEPRATTLVRWLALGPLIGGFENIGVVDFRRNLNFQKDFRLGVYKKAVPFVVTIGTALIVRDYRALVVGILTGRLAGVALSYGMHPFRARLSMRAIAELWSFSIWILWLHLAQFLGREADRIVVGRVASPTGMGYYSVAGDLGTLPTSELMVPISRALLPVYAKLLDQPVELGRTYANVLASLSFIAISVSTGIALVSPDLVSLLLGDQWSASAPLVSWLAIAGAADLIANTGHTLMNSMGRARTSATLMWLRVLVVILAVAVAGMLHGVLAIAMTRATVMVLLAPLPIWVAVRPLGLSGSRILAATWRPIVAALFMALVLWYLSPIQVDETLVRLLFHASLGAFAFVGIATALWWVSGKPPGAEAALIEYIGRKLRGRSRSSTD